ncbi:hypothetical protein EDD18DRAFT_118660 [Armillaria luteobubalina]|uniref:Centrosomin N-terminal motif 1 domain-containing protein n=1 Tax=Armillaria luteobubalina TaxID=153913 RepID=A0AA39UPG0_9AGAR|nr:hypothetical protein EDD18DRAFT_118660 [Armillaria luteobubalina]
MPAEQVDSSLQSTDISLGSLDSSLGPPNTSHTLATPKGDYSRGAYLEDTDGDCTPAVLRARRKSGAKGALTLRDQEKHIDHLKKENFDIKIKCHFLEERLAQLAPDQMDAALKQNIDLKIELSARGQEIKRLKKLLLELERELERMQRAAGRGRERELEEKLEEREREIRELRRRQGGRGHEHEAELEEARELLEESNVEIERLREMLEARDDEPGDSRLKERVAELEAANEEWQQRMQSVADEYEEEKQELVGSIESMGVKIEQLQHRNEAQMQERSESRAMMLDEREHREAVEDDLNEVKDRLAAALIELQQKEDEVEVKNEELDNLVVQHENIVEQWRGEVEETRGQVEELRDVLAERDAESKDLRLNINELEANTEDLHAKFEAALAHLEREAESENALEEGRDEVRQQRRALDAKESALQSALNDLSRAQSLLSQRETDLEAVQTVLRTLESESKRAGETHSTAQFSLQLEVDRLKRDLERVEDELARARKELDERESRGRDKDGDLDKLHSENRELSSQLAAQTQARLNLSEKLDVMQGNLRTAEGEVAAFKARVGELEARLGKDQRSLLNAESQYRDQLTERNTLLLTIYQYMDKILGVDKTKKGETKPYTNFGVFHDNLITRLKALVQIQLDFDRRCKEVEGRLVDKLAEMRRQLDARWKQVDKFEASAKAYAEAKAGWRRKFSAKEGELEALKTTNAEMAAQLTSTPRTGHTDTMELRSLSTRAVNAERRLHNAQNQLLATEEKMAQMGGKSVAAEAKWEARVKEYEARLRAAEERVKRERQGGKERVAELEASVRALQRQLDLAQRRSHQLNEVVAHSQA